MARTRLALALALALLALSAALLTPQPAAAQNVFCTIGEGLPSPLRTSLPGTYWAEGQVVVEDVTLTLRFCAPSSRSVDADKMLVLARRALPVLDELTDVRLDGSHTRVFFLNADRQLSEIHANGSIDEQDRILLREGIADRTLVHELAHYWADGERFDELWMVEAYAEYLTSLAMPRLGEIYVPRSTQPACAAIPLTRWRRDIPGAELCPYAVGPQVFHALAQRAGEDTVRRVIGEITRAYGTVDSKRLHIELERASVANLSPVLREAVFGPEEDGFLMARAALHERYAAAVGQATILHASLPPSLFEDLRSWRDNDLAAALGQLEPLLASAAIADRRCAELDLPCVRPWEQSLGDPARWASLEAFLAGTPQILSTYDQLRAGAGNLGLAVPEDLRRRAGQLTDEALLELQKASGVLAAVSAVEGRCAILGLGCRGLWQPGWERGDLDAVARTVADLGSALDAGVAIDGRCGDLAARCRELWTQGLVRGGPAGAQAAVGDLDALLASAAAAEARCGSLAPRCRELWHAGLTQGAAGDAQAVVAALEQLLASAETLGARCGAMAESCARLWQGDLAAGTIADAGARIAALEALVGHGEQLGQRCNDAGWPCADGWSAALAAGDPGRAEAVLERQEAALPGLRSTSDLVAGGGCCFPGFFGGTVSAADADAAAADPLAEARAAFARGDIAEAEALAEVVRERRAWQDQIILGVGAIGATVAVAALTALLVVARRRARGAPSPHPRAHAGTSGRTQPVPAGPARQTAAGPGAPPAGDLLTQLLSRPPEEPRP